MIPHVETGRRAAADRLIDCLLETTLQASGDASQVDLHVIDRRQGQILLTPPRYRLTNSVARFGPSRRLLPNQLATPDDGDLGFCLHESGIRLFRDCQISGIAHRFGWFTVSDVLVCPIVSTRPEPLGALFMLWTIPDRLPIDADLTDVVGALERTAAQLAAVLDLCDMATFAPPYAEAMSQAACLV